MATRGIRGQSIASALHGAVLFGGFDDVFIRLDLFTGRITQIESSGRTVLYPWDEAHFVCMEETLGRPAKTRLTLRPLGEPREIGAADGEWASERRLIPGHYPAAFALGGGRLESIDVEVELPSNARAEFVPGVFVGDMPVLVDGALHGVDPVMAGVGVGRNETAFLATTDGLAIATGASVDFVRQESGSWRPAAIEHDPVAGRLMVATWNRWRSLGGPSTDIYVFDESGGRVARGRTASLVERIALDGQAAVVMDVEERIHSVELSAWDV